MAGMVPTQEQQAVLQAFMTGDDLVVEAGAGAGKTSTLKLLANARPGASGLYLGFNRAIVREARQKMPRNIACSTPHALAYRQHGAVNQHRLDAPRQRSADLAERFRISAVAVTDVLGTQVEIDAGAVAGIVQRSLERFYTSSDLEPLHGHVVPIPGMVMTGIVASSITAHVARAWDDVQSADGTWPFSHNAYLKMWALTNPVLAFDFILFDEAQDANPVMSALVSAQRAQKVWVGDSSQAIYAFNGAVDALRSFTGCRRSLTQSFRFGPAIADVANHLLRLPCMDTSLRIVGTPSIRSMTVAPNMQTRLDAIITRTNAGAIDAAILFGGHHKVAVVGGTKEVERFAYGASKLKRGEPTDHPSLACFSTWPEVRTYAKHDAAGADLATLVGLIDRFGIQKVVGACKRCVPEAQATLVISTAHKSKGREWDHIRIWKDFPDDMATDADEARLAYVAITRARLSLCIADTPIAELIDGTEVPSIPDPPLEAVDTTRPRDGLVRRLLDRNPLKRRPQRSSQV